MKKIINILRKIFNKSEVTAEEEREILEKIIKKIKES